MRTGKRNTSNCIPFVEFKQIAEQGRAVRSPPDLQHRRIGCDACRRLLRIVQQLRQTAAADLDVARDWPSDQHLDVWAFVERYLADDLNPLLASVFLAHLLSCRRCYAELHAVISEAFADVEAPPPADLDTARQRFEWLDEAVGIRPASGRRQLRASPRKVAIRRAMTARWHSWPGAVRVGAVLAVIAVIALGGVQARSFLLLRQAQKMATSALADLREAHFLSGEWPWRPSGGFRTSPFTELRGPGSRADSLLSSAREKLHRARRLAASEALVLHRLGLYHLIEGRLDSAAIYLEAARKQSARNPEVLNDLALLHRALGDTLRAERLWRETLRLEPPCRECLFNLALLYQQRRDTTAAISTWRTYLQQAAKLDSLDRQLRLLEFARKQFLRLRGEGFQQRKNDIDAAH